MWHGTFPGVPCCRTPQTGALVVCPVIWADRLIHLNQAVDSDDRVVLVKPCAPDPPQSAFEFFVDATRLVLVVRNRAGAEDCFDCLRPLFRFDVVRWRPQFREQKSPRTAGESV